MPIALLLAQASAAQAVAACDEPVTQLDMNICSYQEFQAVDRKLNEAWKIASGLARQGGEPSFDLLLDAQRKWLAYRDAHCLSVTGPREGGGTIWPLLSNMCLKDVTEARTAQLRAYAERDN